MNEFDYYNEGFYIRENRLVYLKRNTTSFFDPLTRYTVESFFTLHHSKHVDINDLIKYEPLSHKQLSWLKDKPKELESIKLKNESKGKLERLDDFQFERIGY